MSFLFWGGIYTGQLLKIGMEKQKILLDFILWLQAKSKVEMWVLFIFKRLSLRVLLFFTVLWNQQLILQIHIQLWFWLESDASNYIFMVFFSLLLKKKKKKWWQNWISVSYEAFPSFFLEGILILFWKCCWISYANLIPLVTKFPVNTQTLCDCLIFFFMFTRELKLAFRRLHKQVHFQVVHTWFGIFHWT